MITIKHLTGPLAGEEAQFGDDRERIVFGRDPALCDVVFPADFTKVGREHFALLRELSGDYAVEPFGDHYVEVDGVPATPQSSIPATCTLRLGQTDGPTLQLVVDASKVSAALPQTDDQEKVTPARVVSSRARNIALGAVALAVLAAAGLGVFAYQTEVERKRQQAVAEDLARQVVVLNDREKAQAAQMISAPDRERLAASVYAVVRQDPNGGESLLGTAWAVRPNLLATNAHVAVAFNSMRAGEHLLVRPAGGGDYHYQVDKVQIHPGFEAFNSFVASDPFFVQGFGGEKPIETVGGYDVALMHVRTALPKNMILAIEDADRIARLAPGDAVALAGFPYENIVGSEVQPLGRTAQLQVGNITSLSDFFLLPAEPDQRHLVQHNLPLTGGASGSPIIDSNGKVVAIASAINLFSINGARVPNAALVNYAQRVDALQDLLAGAANAHLQVDQAYWLRQTAAFKRGMDLIIPEILNRLKPAANHQPVLVGEYSSATSPGFLVNNTNDSGQTFSLRMRSFIATLKASSQHVFIAYAKNSAPILGLLVAVDGRAVAHAERSGINSVYLSYTAPDADQIVTLLVGTPEEEGPYILRDYVWQASP